MQLTFGNMTLELNIFHLGNKHKLAEDDIQGSEEVCSIGPRAGKPNAHKLQAELVKESEAVDWELAASVTPAEPMKRSSTKGTKHEGYSTRHCRGSRSSSSFTLHEWN